MRRLIRDIVPSSPSGTAGGRSLGGPRLGSSADGSAGGGVTTNSGSRPRRRSSTEPGASSVVISSAAAASASCSGEPDRRVQRRDQALGERPSLVAAGLGGDRELAVDVLDVQF